MKSYHPKTLYLCIFTQLIRVHMNILAFILLFQLVKPLAGHLLRVQHLRGRTDRAIRLERNVYKQQTVNQPFDLQVIVNFINAITING